VVRLVQVMQRLPRGSNINWRIETPQLLAAVDPDDLGEVLGNLLDNARKNATSVVEIKGWQSGKQILVQVSDDGPGIPEALTAVAHERGMVLSDTESSGLGLSIVHEMIKPYGGDLRIARSALGGAAVTVSLPCAQSDKH
jgi:signal transduction histidine kinase